MLKRDFLPKKPPPCKAVTAPIGESGSVSNAADSTEVLTLVSLEDGSPTYKGGIVTNQSCDPLKLEVGILDGGDCIPCTTDVLSIVTQEYTIPPYGIFKLGDYNWQTLTAIRVDDNGVPIVSSNGQDSIITFSTEYSPECPACVIYAIATSEVAFAVSPATTAISPATAKFQNCDDKDLTIDVSESYITNADFNEYIRLPTTISQLSRAVGWRQFSDGTSDYFHEDGYIPIFSQPSPNGGGHASMLMDATYNYYEYVAKSLETPIPQGSEMLVNMYAGGGRTSYTSKDTGVRILEIYAIPVGDIKTPITSRNHIEGMGVGAVKVAEYQLTVEGSDWEKVSLSFTAPFDIGTLVFGGNTTDPDQKTLSIDGLLVAEKEKFFCP